MSDKQPTQSKAEPLSDEDRSDIKQSTQSKHLNSNEISKSLWIKIPKNDFILLINHVVDNLDDKNYQTTVYKGKYDLKNAEKYLLEIITKKTSKDEARKLYNGLIKPDIDPLKHVKGKDKNKRDNILNILNNMESILFEGVYCHYKDVPKETEYERSITERAKLRRQRMDEVKKEKKT